MADYGQPDKWITLIEQNTVTEGDLVLTMAYQINNKGCMVKAFNKTGSSVTQSLLFIDGVIITDVVDGGGAVIGKELVTNK